jgi:hypothetical protein
VSLLNALKISGLPRHLDDAQFMSIWHAAIESGQGPADAHLADCQQCRTRYAAFTAWMERVREDGRADADEIFTPERLAAQQAQVLRRLEASERPARVIAFPKFAHPVTSTQGHAQRWVAAAAAAGLVIGIAAGQFVDIRETFGGRQINQQVAQNARAVPTDLSANPSVTPAAARPVSDESLFFGDGIQRAAYSPLQPMDDITPRARDLEFPR